MKINSNALLVCAIQLLLISSIAGKYLYERSTRPRIWIQVSQHDPESPMRGRYLALQPIVNACGLNKADANHIEAYSNDTYHQPEAWDWRVKLILKDGTLKPVASDEEEGARDSYFLQLLADEDCKKASVHKDIEMYIAENAKTPFPLEKGSELWMEATIPPAGSPRAVRLAIKKDGVMTPLNLN